MKSVLFTGVAGLLALSSYAMAATSAPGHYSGDRYATQAKITLEQAQAITLKARPGTVTDEELEKEKGGSGLRYSFDIKVGDITFEVGIDAKTGVVLENAAEGKNPD